MGKTSVPKSNVEHDLLNLTKYMMKPKYSAIVVQQWKLGNLKFSVSKTLKKDGLTRFGKTPPMTQTKKCTVIIKKSVAMSKFICWRMATLLHELSHVLHHFHTDVFEDEEHGEDWMIRFKEIICRGELKECAKKLESPDPACLYKRQRCVWCPPNGEEYSSSEEFIFPKMHEKSSFGGNCFFCFTSDSIIKHLNRSICCKNKYINIYGPQYKAKLAGLVAKEKRIKKRLGKSTGQPVCRFCPIEGEKFLFVHLRTNADCAKKYMKEYKCQTEEELRQKISKEKARLRKRKQRANQQREGH